MDHLLSREKLLRKAFGLCDNGRPFDSLVTRDRKALKCIYYFLRKILEGQLLAPVSTGIHYHCNQIVYGPICREDRRRLMDRSFFVKIIIIYFCFSKN